MERAKAILVFTATVFFPAVGLLVPFGGFAPDAFPVPQADPPVQPAGYAFSIWGLIYLWLLAMGGFGLFRRADDMAWDRTRWPLFVSLAVGTAWLPVASQSPEWATVLIWVMLATAAVALVRAPRADAWWLAVPVGLYAGWLTAASSVSIGLLGAGYGLLFGQVGWAVAAVALALVVAVFVLPRAASPLAYAAALAWALVGIVVQNLGGPLIVAAVACLGLAAVAALALRVRSSGTA